ncbi:multiple epidermal growth factor-like domains protein 10 [Pomacea canaliculata]|uniref:multiple epidermal growth factor-like domains protein 10 n=1 Tax=Pomacea canaliculata TaxID=400727 RepID=UPI000D72BFE2|nr:multiple epidermal growth factor-like domains protein 10 [Pomacea canaliculata]
MEFLQETRVVAYFFAFAAPFLHTVQCPSPVSSKKYELCRVVESTLAAIGVYPVRSVLECITLCATQGSCRSVTICEHDLTKTCSLLPTSLPCPSMPSGDTCFLAQVYDVCQNGGIFNTTTVRCDCSLGWQGDHCQTPTATSTNTVHQLYNYVDLNNHSNIHDIYHCGIWINSF